jgi:drug/metabolite transporter (DMT)-like permease
MGAAVLTFAVVAGSALLFSAKGIMAKLAYAGGADAITVLLLRTALSLPVFAVVLWWTNSRAAYRLTSRDWVTLSLLGFFGWYLASWLDFKGLEYISAGLERIVLFTYPIIVVLVTAVRRRRPPGLLMTAATLAAWAGVAVAFAGEAGARGVLPADLWTGTALVLYGSISYAVFILISGDIVKRIGSARFIAAVSTVSSVLMIIHWACVKPLSSLSGLPPVVWQQGVLLATLATIVPAFLTGWGLKLAGSQRFAVIGAIGPAGTLLMAALWLGESVDAARLGGFVLTLAGSLTATLLRDAPVAASAEGDGRPAGL